MSDRTPEARLVKSTTVRAQLAVAAVRTGLRAAHWLPGDLGPTWAGRLFSTPRRHPRPARERALLASAQPLGLDVVLGAPAHRGEVVRLAAWRWGRGPTVLLVHGWEGRGAQLGAVVEPLVDAGLSVLTFDAPAHGDSPGDRLILADLADAVRAAARAAGELHGIVAHSFGALATTLALARGVDAARVAYLAPATVIHSATASFARFVGLAPGEVERLHRRMTELNGFAPDDALPERLYPRIEPPLLFVHDRDEYEVPFDDARRLAAAVPGSRLVATVGLGHRRILRDPAVIAGAVQFVAAGAHVAAPDPTRRPFVDAWVAPIQAERLVASLR